MFTDDDQTIFWDVDDESLMTNALLDLVPVFAQNDVSLFFHSEPFADWTTAQDVDIESLFISTWNNLSNIEDGSAWNIVSDLARDIAWNILNYISNAITWNDLSRTDDDLTWNIAGELASDTAWNILIGLSDVSTWNTIGTKEVESTYHIIIDWVEGAIWNILNSTDISLMWRALNEGMIDVATAWHILTSSGSVELNWNAITLDTLSFQWSLLNEVARDTSWRDISAAEFALLWNIVGLYSIDVQALWNILSDRSKSVRWRVRTSLRMGVLWLLRSESQVLRYILDELVAAKIEFEIVASHYGFEFEADFVEYMIEIDPVDALHNEANTVGFEFKAMPKGGWK